MLWINSIITEGQGSKEWVMYVPAYTSWISVAMGYSDVPSLSPDLQVDLDMVLISPSSTEYSYQLPAGVPPRARLKGSWSSPPSRVPGL